VRPGDTRHVERQVVDKKPSASKPDRGIICFDYRMMNQRVEAVLLMLAMHLLKRQA
jgi:acyl dehydratase